LIIQLQPADKNFPLARYFFGYFGGLVGVVVGLGLGLVPGSVLVATLHVSPREGGAGYFAVAIVLIVALIIMPSSIVFVLYGAQG
jgi:hypothetical protein